MREIFCDRLRGARGSFRELIGLKYIPIITNTGRSRLRPVFIMKGPLQLLHRVGQTIGSDT